MSRVFLAEEVDLGRYVVIKVLPPEMAADVNQERFHREIQLAANLQHPHIVSLLTAGAQDDLLYYVMPHIKGESLRAKLARGGELPVGEAVRFLKEIVDALAYAHREGVVHRDIKPDNVLLSEGHAVVTDFGVAKAVTASSGSSSLTSLGVALGTPAYMAPEQAAADPHTDHRADIYAVGTLAYEMLCGEPPFTGPTPQAVMAAHMRDAAEPVSRRRPAVSEVLNSVIMRCLEKRAADRWQRAEELLPHLDAILTPTGGITPTGTAPLPAVDYEAAARRSHPVRVAALFGLASIGALAIGYFLVIQLGLPDWVFLGAVGLLVIGLPVMLLTGLHERRRALERTTGAVVPTPTTGIRHWFMWRKSLIGSGVAFAGLGVVATVYMAMRLLGIGPAATLMTSGVLDVRDLIIVAEFENRSADTTLGPSITEALRIDLAQSPVLKLVETSDIGPALARMNRAPGEWLDAALAREVALREGYKAVVTGEIAPLGTGYVLSARLVSASTGETLVPVRETAEDAAALIPAVDQLSAKLRERIGESLKTIRSGEPLARVTTASLEALRLYSRAAQVYQEGNYDRAITLLEESIAADTLFAMAYRRLGVYLRNAFRERSRIDAAITRAFELRDRLPPLERYHTTAYYYWQVEPDPDQVIDAYRLVLEIDPENGIALNNLALVLNGQRKWAEAEELYRRAIAGGATYQNYNGLTSALVRQGHWDEAESTVVEFEEWGGPGNPNVLQARFTFAAAQRDYDVADRYVRELQEAGRPAYFQRAILREVQGQLRASEQVMEEALAEAVREENGLNILRGALWPARLELRYRGGPDAAVRKLEEILERYPLETVPAADRPYGTVVEVYAATGRSDVVRRIRSEREAAAGQTLAARYRWDALVAMAEERYEDAIDAYREANEQQGNMIRNLHELARAYELNDQLDSALAVYERAVSLPERNRLPREFDELGPAYKRLGELYEARGDREKAVEYYDKFVALWKDADAELQPVVADVRARIAALVGEP
jgi:tetratricopeptide (TPR) repeat protein